MLSWALSTLALLMASSAAVRRANLERRADRAAALVIVFVCLSIGEVLVLGHVGLLRPTALLSVSVVAAVVGATANLDVLVTLRTGLRRPVATRRRPRWGALGLPCDSFWTIPLLVLGVVAVIWVVSVARVLPAYSYDSVLYHLLAAGVWVQRHGVVITGYGGAADSYPMNVEALDAWLMTFTHSTALAGLAQPICTSGGLIAVAGLARVLELRRATAAGSAAFFGLTPIVLQQAPTEYVDASFASFFLLALYFLARYVVSRQRRLLLFAGLACGLGMGTKTAGLVAAAVLFGALLGCAGFGALVSSAARPTAGSTRGGRIVRVPDWSTMTQHGALFLAAITVTGSYWYLRAWIRYGNPMYPVRVSAFGRTLFPGPATGTSIVGPQTPAKLVGHGRLYQIWGSWTAPTPHWTYEQRLGGFGPLWVWFELPALLLLVFWLVRRRRWQILAVLVAVPGAILLLQPAAWWSRFTIIVLGPGAVALASALERLSPRPLRWAVQAAACGTAVWVGVSALAAVPTLPSPEPPYPTPSFGFSTILGHAARNEVIPRETFLPKYAWVSRLPDGSRVAYEPQALDRGLLGAALGPRLEIVPVTEDLTAGGDLGCRMARDRTPYLLTVGGLPSAMYALAHGSDFHEIANGSWGRLFQVDPTKLCESPTAKNVRAGVRG